MADTVSTQVDPEPNGWLLFAAIVLFVSGTFGVIWGLAALINDKLLVNGGHGLMIADFTTWGWLQLALGGLMLVTSFGLFALMGWARWTAVVFATINACIQVGAFTTFPLWSMVVIALDVIVIYQLTARWVPA